MFAGTLTYPVDHPDGAGQWETQLADGIRTSGNCWTKRPNARTCTIIRSLRPLPTESHPQRTSLQRTEST